MLKNTTAIALAMALIAGNAMVHAQTTTAPANGATSNIPVADPVAVVENVVGPDARIIEIRNRDGMVKIEALQGDSKVEVIMDPATGDLVKTEKETIGSAQDREEYEQKAASMGRMMSDGDHGLGDDNGGDDAHDDDGNVANGSTAMGHGMSSDDGMMSDNDHGDGGDDHGPGGMGSAGGMSSGGGDHDGGDDGGDHDD